MAIAVLESRAPELCPECRQPERIGVAGLTVCGCRGPVDPVLVAGMERLQAARPSFLAWLEGREHLQRRGIL